MIDQDKAKSGTGVKLSRRLAALAGWVPEGARFADIGTDHALLPVYLAGSGRIPFAVAGDINAGPVEAAKRQVEEAGLSAVISVRRGDGLSVLSPGEADTVCIAGMGGSLIVRILEDAGDRLEGVRTLVLSPHAAEDAVRRWLIDRDCVLDREMLLEEDGTMYTLMRAQRGGDVRAARKANRELYDTTLLAPAIAAVSRRLLLEMGPLLIRQGGALFRRKWEQELDKRERIVEQMRRSSSAGAAEKSKILEESMAEIREVLACLPAEKRSFN